MFVEAGAHGATPLEWEDIEQLIPDHIETRAELDEWQAQKLRYGPALPIHSGCVEIQRMNTLQIHGIPRHPEIIYILHRQPAFRAATENF